MWKEYSPVPLVINSSTLASNEVNANTELYMWIWFWNLMALLSLLLKRTSSSCSVVKDSAIEFCHSHNTKKIVGSYCSTLPIVLWSTFSHCKIHILCPFLHNPIVLGLMRFHLQTIAMRHCQEKTMHVMLFVIRFAVFDTNDYFVLVAF
jgi:hypothetical protein